MAKCSVCNHDDREAIDKAILDGVTFRDIGQEYDLSPAAISRHKKDHLPAVLVKAQEASEVAHADTLLDQVRSLQAKALGILAEAEKAQDYRTALMAIREARHNLELLAKLMGDLQQEGTINLLVAPEWLEIRTGIIRAVQPYPEAREALLEVLGRAR